MRMSDRNSRRLAQAVWRERLGKWGPAVVAFAALFALFAYMTDMRLQRADPTVEVHSLAGSVVALLKPPSRGLSVVQVRLADGRETNALSQLPGALLPGTRVTIVESKHASGKLSYDISAVVP